MSRRDVAVLDFGSSKVSCYIGQYGSNNSFNIKGSSEVEYAGFSKGAFLEPSSVKMAVGLAISNAESMAHEKVTEIYVGVPGEFCAVVCKDCFLNFNSKRKISNNDVERLFYVGNTFKNHPTHTVINNTPIYFTLDDNRRIIEPRGMYSTRLAGLVSYVFAENNFLDFVEKMLMELGIRKAEYVCSPLAESLYLFDPEIRDRYAILVDVGHITTTVTLTRGDGLLFMSSFSMGGGQISGDLYKCLKIPYSQADSLKRKVVLSLDASDTDFYELSGKDYISPFSARVTNEIVKARIELIAKYINKCLEVCEYDIPAHLPVYLTGGGLCYIKGAKDFLAKNIGKKVIIKAPDLPTLDRPHLSSVLGLLNLALENQTYGSQVLT